jgi:hypothetical protein
MFDGILSGIGDTIDDAKEALAEQRKSVEKWLIQSLVAHPSHSTSETRKTLTKERKKQGKETLKQVSSSYKSSFSSSAKGQWVNSAKEAVQKVTDTLDAL